MMEGLKAVCDMAYSFCSAFRYGPISIALDDMPQLWFPYKGGIMTGCCNTALAHAVLIVGYGIDAPTGLK